MATSSNPGEGFSAEARDYYYYILADYSVLTQGLAKMKISRQAVKSILDKKYAMNNYL